MMTREEFEEHRTRRAGEMAADGKLHRKVLDVLVRSDHYDWFHQATWMGEPSLQFPQDLFAIQELMYRLRPTYVIELGVAWGGSLLFYASMMKLFGGYRAIGVDTYWPPDLRKRLMGKGPVSDYLTLVEGSSTDEDTVSFLREFICGHTDNLVILDSAHDHAHVLAELNAYSEFVGPGYYLICGDSIIEEMPPQTHRPRPWGPGNSPKTALDEFLVSHPDFEPDREIENKLLITCNPGGYLRRANVDV